MCSQILFSFCGPDCLNFSKAQADQRLRFWPWYGWNPVVNSLHLSHGFAFVCHFSFSLQWQCGWVVVFKYVINVLLRFVLTGVSVVKMSCLLNYIHANAYCHTFFPFWRLFDRMLLRIISYFLSIIFEVSHVFTRDFRLIFALFCRVFSVIYVTCFLRFFCLVIFTIACFKFWAFVSVSPTSDC